MKNNKKILYILFFILISSVLFLLAEPLGIVDIRFVAFLQLSLLLLAAYFFGIVSTKTKQKWLFIFIILIAIIIFVNSQTTYITNWVKWNYQGFENKPLWNEYKQVNDYLKNYSGRVVYEHSQKHNQAGTPRAFESLPLFSGRPTLEGLYMQSSITAPFVFYIQAEISKKHSCPFWKQWECDSKDLERGLEHLRLFNVKHFIIRTNKIKQKMRNRSNWELVKTIKPFSIYETNNAGYVTLMQQRPTYKNKEKWKRKSYEWFKHEPLSKRIVFNKQAYELYTENNKTCNINEIIKNEKILINTTCINQPLIISVSYHPRWQVEGGKGPFLVSPSFMLIYPQQNNVRLYYSRTLVDNISFVLSVFGFFILLYLISKNIYYSKFSKRK